MKKDYSGHTTQSSRIHFGIRRTKKLKAYLHWIQDFYRISEEPLIEEKNGIEFNAQINIALERARIRKQLRNTSGVKSKEAFPGPLLSESKWIDWETKFVNYLSMQVSINVIPLSYIVRENDNPPVEGTIVYTSFVKQTVACAPLTGNYYEADQDEVHQALVSYTAGNPSENWIKSVARYHNGRRSLQALRYQFAGEGNQT